MEEYTVLMTPQAEEQLQEIVRYIANTLQEPIAAIRLLDTLENEIDSLSIFPARAALTEEEPWRSYGIHKIPVKNYLIYFWIDETDKTVHITAVIYGKRDQRQQLKKLEME